ncbi:MAG: hypothetical protein JNK84_21915 [Phreatobacter sp.]|uniref:hypothetical protein n=1 Tax=Phreatobacter sp. TaxID=1966341 RepID=UPI001A54E161|nr:hypothetical protein [Phreatobacter sp.]MBL8571741.1 hypothetical protein [Phreatobacter sp.]
MTLSRRAVAAIALSILPSAAFASAPERGPNGGWKVDAGPRHHVEVVFDGSTTISVYVSDGNSRPISAEGFSGTATVVVNGNTHRVPLAAKEGSRLTGTAPVAIPAGTKGAIQLQIPGGGNVRAVL